MNNKLNLVEKSVEIFTLSVEIENLNSTLCNMLYGTQRDNEALVKIQDELFMKRCRLAELEKEYKAIEENITGRSA